MLNRLNSIKYQILAVFLSFTILISFLSIASYWYNEREERIRYVENWIDQLNLLVINLIRQDMNFLSAETVNPSFFETGKSNILIQRSAIRTEIFANITKLSEEEDLEEFMIKSNLVYIDSLLEKYDHTFHEISNKVFIKGYKSYGLIGELNRFSEQLETIDYQIDLKKVLRLRDNERDFYVRNELKYADNVNKISQSIIEDLKKDYKKDQFIVELMEQYIKSFNELVLLEKEIGIYGNDGLTKNLTLTSDLILSEFENIATSAEIKEIELISRLRRIFAIVAAVCILASMAMSYFFAVKLTDPIRLLSEAINSFVSKGFQGNLKMNFSSSTYELQLLSKSFNNMVDKIKDQIFLIEDKTRELEKQNEDLKEINQQLQLSEKGLQESNLDKDRFFSIIAHDLKSPIATISSFLKIMINHIDGFSKEETKKLATEMLTSVTNLTTLLENLLEWSRAQLGNLQYNPSAVDLNEIMKRNVALNEGKAKTKSITLTCDNCDDRSKNVLAFVDQNMIDFVIRNLISNAVKFTDKEGNVNIGILPFEESDKYLSIYVKDNGVGMDQVDLEKLFRKDLHFTKRGTAQEKGTGLGLLLCKEFIDKNKGKITVESEIGKGTTFFVEVLQLSLTETEKLG